MPGRPYARSGLGSDRAAGVQSDSAVGWRSDRAGGEHVRQEGVETRPSAASRARSRASDGSVPIVAGSACRRNDGSTTTASCPVSARLAVQSAGSVRGPIPLEREPAQRERAVDQLPDRVLAAGAEDVVPVARTRRRARLASRARRRAPRSGGRSGPCRRRSPGRSPTRGEPQVADAQRLERRHPEPVAACAEPAARGRRPRPSPSGTRRGAGATRGSRGSRRRPGGRSPPVGVAQDMGRGLGGRVRALRHERRASRRGSSCSLGRRPEHVRRRRLVEARRRAVHAQGLEQAVHGIGVRPPAADGSSKDRRTLLSPARL